MLRTVQVSSIQQSVPCIFCIGNQFVQSIVGCNELTEVIVCLAISFLAEFNRTLDNGYFIFIFHSFFIHHLQDNVCLSQSEVSQLILTQSSDGCNILQIITIHLSTFIVGRRNPCCLTCLAVLLGYFSKVCTAFNGCVDTVSQSLGLGNIFCNHLNLTILNGVRHSSRSQFLERIDCIVRCIIVRTIYTTYLYRIQTGNNVSRQRLVCKE